MFITKLDAARRQLCTAIELWFSDGDPISIHALAYASHEIIHRAYRRRGLSNLLYDSSVLTDKQRKEFPILLKQSANFIKHAAREAEVGEKTFFNSAATDLFLIFSAIGLQRMGEKLNETESAFMFWLYLHNPGWFIEEQIIKDRVPVERLNKIRGVEKGGGSFVLSLISRGRSAPHESLGVVAIDFVALTAYTPIMTKHKPLTAAERAAEIAKLDLRPAGEANKRTDDLLRTLLTSPPDPFTPKAKPAKRAKK